MMPILRWLPSYDRAWLRGDVAAGIAVTALIVPKNLGYAGIAGVPLQNGLYAAAAGAIVYPLFCTSRQISTGPSSSLAAVAGGAVVVAGLAGDQAAQLVAAIALVTGLLFLALALLRLGWIARFLSKAVVTGFLAGAAIDVVIGELPKLTGTEAEGDERVARAGVVARLARRHPLGDGRRRRRGAGRDPRAAVRRAVGAGRAGPGRRGRARRLPPRPRRARGRARRRRAARPAGAGAAGPRARRRPHRDGPRGVGRARADRLLADRRRRAHVRRAPPVPDRRRPGVGRAGHGERRGGARAGHAGLDEPFRELPERVGGREDAGRVAHHRGARAADPGRARAGVLGAAEGGSRRGDHRRGRVRDDRRRRAAAAAPRRAVRLRDRARGDRRGADRRACSPAS